MGIKYTSKSIDTKIEIEKEIILVTDFVAEWEKDYKFSMLCPFDKYYLLSRAYSAQAEKEWITTHNVSETLVLLNLANQAVVKYVKLFQNGEKSKLFGYMEKVISNYEGSLFTFGILTNNKQFIYDIHGEESEWGKVILGKSEEIRERMNSDISNFHSEDNSRELLWAIVNSNSVVFNEFFERRVKMNRRLIKNVSWIIDFVGMSYLKLANENGINSVFNIIEMPVALMDTKEVVDSSIKIIEL